MSAEGDTWAVSDEIYVRLLKTFNTNVCWRLGAREKLLSPT